MNSQTKMAIDTIHYCLKHWSKNKPQRRECDLERESYLRWAVDEILVLLENSNDTPPLLVIEEFRDKMDRYSCLNSRTSYVFSCAKDTAEWIIDLLIS